MDFFSRIPKFSQKLTLSLAFSFWKCYISKSDIPARTEPRAWASRMSGKGLVWWEIKIILTLWAIVVLLFAKRPS